MDYGEVLFKSVASQFLHIENTLSSFILIFCNSEYAYYLIWDHLTSDQIRFSQMKYGCSISTASIKRWRRWVIKGNQKEKTNCTLLLRNDDLTQTFLFLAWQGVTCKSYQSLWLAVLKSESLISCLFLIGLKAFIWGPRLVYFLTLKGHVCQDDWQASGPVWKISDSQQLSLQLSSGRV